MDIPKFDNTPAGNACRAICEAVDKGDERSIDRAFNSAIRLFGQEARRRQAADRAARSAAFNKARSAGDVAAMRKMAAANLAKRYR